MASKIQSSKSAVVAALVQAFEAAKEGYDSTKATVLLTSMRTIATLVKGLDPTEGARLGKLIMGAGISPDTTNARFSSVPPSQRGRQPANHQEEKPRREAVENPPKETSDGQDQSPKSAEKQTGEDSPEDKIDPSDARAALNEFMSLSQSERFKQYGERDIVASMLRKAKVIYPDFEYSGRSNNAKLASLAAYLEKK